MPEEINRIVTDHVSDLLFCPTTAGMENLRVEGLNGRAVLTGDVMLDAVLANLDVAVARTVSPAYRCGLDNTPWRPYIAPRTPMIEIVSKRCFTHWM